MLGSNKNGRGFIEDSFPLSPMQQGMVSNTLLEPESGVDIEQVLCGLHEPLDVVALREAWQRLTDRHPMLRASLHWENLERPQQEIHSRVDLSWEEQDWTHVIRADRQRRLEDFLGADRRRGFTLDRAPLFRLALLRYADDDYLLVWTLHHAMMDGSSFIPALQEVFSIYEGIRAGREVPLPPPRSYREYIDWLEKQDFSASDAFWRENLKGFAVPTPLTVVHRPVSLQDGRARKDTRKLQMSEQTTAELYRLAKENAVTLNTIVQGAWALLLWTYSGQRDVVFGVIRANRQSSVADAWSIVGLFVNTLPLRVQVDPERELVPWLKELRGQWLRLREHEHTPLARIQSLSEIAPDVQLFQSAVIFEHESLNDSVRNMGTEWSNRSIRHISQTNYSLELEAIGGDRLHLAVDYDRTRIDAVVADRMIDHLQNLLEDMSRRPGSKLGELSMLGADERHTLLEEWNSTAIEDWPVVPIHELFEQQVARTPHAVALESGEQRLTYAELDQRSARLARRLRNFGVGKSVLVGVLAESSFVTIAGLLATLRAGGAYIPLSTRHPAERISAIVKDSNPAVVLTQEKWKPLLSATHGMRILTLDGGEEATEEGVDRLPTGDVEDIAYVIYTSGTTGRPKGVMVPHSAICNQIRWMQRMFPIDASDAVLQKTGLDFDVSVWEIFAPLAAGSRLVIGQEGGEFDPSHIVSLLEKHRVTAIQLTPVQLNLLLQEPAFTHCAPPLKHVFCGGEALSVDTCRQFREILPRATLSNMYGPTESSIDATHWNCPRDGDIEIVPIGKPIDNVKCHIVNESMQLLPTGIPGELVIGGKSLARGYLGDSRLTAEKFVADAFSQEPGARLYKTGDKARYLRDGNIEYLGRLDRQIKVRGLRIELQEIETAISRHPKVRACCVTTFDEEQGDSKLVAYVVPETKGGPNSQELREYLRRSLPEYMVPGQFVDLRELPLRPSGKIDHQRLPAPQMDDTSRPIQDPPRTPTEVALSNIWSELLHTRDFGIRDSFVDLGGNSLRLVQLIREIDLMYGVKLGIAEIVRNATVEQLATRVESAQSAQNQDSRVVKFHKGEKGPPVYFMFAGLPEYRIARRMNSQSNVYGVESRWPLAWHTALRSDRSDQYPRLEEVVARYVDTLHVHSGSRPCVIVGLSFAGLMAFEAARQLRERGGEVLLVIVVDAEATLANPYKLAWNLWRRSWAGHSADGSTLPFRLRLDNTWETTKLIITKAVSRAKTSIAPPQPDLDILTHLFDEQHRPIPWAMVERFYTHAYATYRPSKISCRGVLIRTEDIERTAAHGESLGWENLFAKGLESISLGGNHFSIFDENIPNLAREISSAVSRNHEV